MKMKRIKLKKIQKKMIIMKIKKFKSNNKIKIK